MILNYAINYDIFKGHYVSEILNGRSELNGCYGWGKNPKIAFIVMKIAVELRKKRLKMENKAEK